MHRPIVGAAFPHYTFLDPAVLSEDVNDCVPQLYDEFMHAGHVLPIDLLSSIPCVVHLLTRRFPLSYEHRRRIQVLQVWYSQGNL